MTVLFCQKVRQDDLSVGIWKFPCFRLTETAQNDKDHLSDYFSAYY